MTASASLFSDPVFLQSFFGTGILGFRGFWKVSSLSKSFISLRDDSSSMGCGSVCSGFDAISEREEVWGFVNDCLTRDNVRALRQVLEVPGLAHRYPFLLRRALELGSRNDASRPSPPILVNPLKCVEFLSERHITSVSPEISPEAVSTLTRDRLAVLLKSGAVQPNSWVFAGVERASEGRPPVAQPLLIALIDARKFDSAAALMDAGARVDVCEWVASVSARGEAEGAELTFPLDYSTAGRSPLHALVSTVCEERAERLRFAADRGVDIDSDGGESSLAEGGRDVVGEQDREKNAVRLALLRRIAVASQEAGCFHWAVKTVACRVWMDKTICNALSLVSLCGDFEGLRVLLEAQGCLRPSDRSLPFTAVAGMVTGYAKRSELLAVLKVLAERGMDFAKVGVGYFFRDRVCLLSLVCRRCSVECAEFLLQRGAPVNGGGGGMVPLIESLQNPPGGGPITSLLLQWGADANQIGLAKRRTLWGQLSSPPLRLYTPLQLIATSQLDNNGLDAETVVRTAQLLIDHGARCSQTEETNPPSEEQNDAPPRSRVSPLHAACMCSLELVRLLCEKGGADPNIPGVHDDDPPVSDLQDYPVPYVVSVPYLAGTRVMLREWQNRPDQMMARVVEVLAESGADLNRRLANDGHSPLSLACRRNMKSTAEALVRKGAAVNGGQALGRKRRLPLSEALVFSPASHSPPRFSLVSLLLQAGADPNEIGLFEPPQPLSLPATRAYPLQAVMYRLVAPAGGPDSEREVAELTKLLVHAGARCAPRALLPDSEASEGVGVETQQLPEQSRISPLLFACCMRDSALVRFLCESGGADPNASGVIIKNKQVWEMGCPLAAVLTHRRTENASMNAWCEEFYSDSEDSGAEWDRERELEREANMALKKSWILVETLVEMGADPALLATRWPPETDATSRRPEWGSGSWLADLICCDEGWVSSLFFEGDEARLASRPVKGPLLLQIIQSVPLRELEKPHGINPNSNDMGSKKWYQKRWPLRTAIEERWEVGVMALLERGVAVNATGARAEHVKSPLMSTIASEQWKIVKELLVRGGELSERDKPRFSSHAGRYRKRLESDQDLCPSIRADVTGSLFAALR